MKYQDLITSIQKASENVMSEGEKIINNIKKQPKNDFNDEYNALERSFMNHYNNCLFLHLKYKPKFTCEENIRATNTLEAYKIMGRNYRNVISCEMP